MSRAPCLHATAHQRLHACLAEQAHVGCPEFLTEFKDYGALTEDQVDFNNMLQFYRGRNEHLVAAVKHGRNALDTKWRGSFLGLASVLRIVVHMVRHLAGAYAGTPVRVFRGPVCPDSIVRRYV